jgi:hypothetical protein
MLDEFHRDEFRDRSSIGRYCRNEIRDVLAWDDLAKRATGLMTKSMTKTENVIFQG